MTTAVLAEKPSVARDIARVLGADQRGEGYLHGNGYVVTWAVGHLAALAQPHEINPAWRQWRSETLPMLPDHWPLIVVEQTKDQFEIVRRILNSPKTGRVVCATDAGREGELIFRYIYEAAGCSKPVSRLWISSLTPDAIRAGFDRLRPAAEFDDLADAARGRSRADWLVGMNLSRAYSLGSRENYSVGRVQTPTLAMLVERELAIRAFVPEDYIEVVTTFHPQGAPAKETYQGTWFREPREEPNAKRLPAAGEEANQIVERARAGQAAVESVQSSTERMAPPLLYDLTELQRHANRLYGYSAQKTLDLAQSLYEKFKLISYPRTDSRHLSKDVAATLPAVVRTVAGPYSASLAPGAGERPLGRRFVDDAKVTDHHAIIPTVTRRPESLPPEEARIYDLVCRRLLSAWHADYITSVTTVITAIQCEGITDRYHSSGTTVEQTGWKILDIVPPRKAAKSVEPETQVLPPGLAPGQPQDVIDAEAVRKKTRPPKRFTEGTLLTAMETAGKTLDDKELSDAMKECGLGTPATRAAIIEVLLKRDYAVRNGKTLEATDKGITLIEVVHPEVKSPAMTGQWEAYLNRIRRGQAHLAPFLQGIESYVREVIAKLTHPPTSPTTHIPLSPSAPTSLTAPATPTSPVAPSAPTSPSTGGAAPQGREPAPLGRRLGRRSVAESAALEGEVGWPAPPPPPPTPHPPSPSAPTSLTGPATPASPVAPSAPTSPSTGGAAPQGREPAPLGRRSLEGEVGWPAQAPAPPPPPPLAPPQPTATLAALLERAFGFSAFRPNQEAVCHAVIEGRDVLLVMSTGSGKSLCYQLPGVARGGTTLVISPLIALMEDQVAKLRQRGLAVDCIHSGRDRSASRETCFRYLSGDLQFLYVAPERLRVAGFPEMLAKRKPSLVAIDEAHCISQWGHDFRPDYRMLGQHLPSLRPAPVIALTATATPRVQADIVEQLGLASPARFVHGFRRSNIAIEVVEVPPSRRTRLVCDLIEDESRRPAIVYTPTRKQAESVAAELAGICRAAAYHAGLDADHRQRVQQQFLAGRIEVMVATIAFGMGIDKPDIRTVAHTALPGSLEAYYQEVGRAGRDGLPSHALLMHSYADRHTHDFFFERDYPDVAVLDSLFKRLGLQPIEKDRLRNLSRLGEDEFDKALEKLWIHGGAMVDYAENVTAGSAPWRNSYIAHGERKRAQIDEMIRYAETDQCRMSALVRHFGDFADAGTPCGICDFCAPGDCVAQRFRPATPEELDAMRRVLDSLRTRGSRATGRLHSELFPAREFSRDSLEEGLGALARAGLVRLSDAAFEKDGRQIPYRTATLTQEGRLLGPGAPLDLLYKEEILAAERHRRKTKKTKKKQEAPPKPQPRRSKPAKEPKSAREKDQEPALEQALRQWRLAEARRHGVPAFRIFSDKVLRAIAETRPANAAELLAIPGIGINAVEKYGRHIYRILDLHGSP